jgi:hypothetical protein
MMTKKLIPLIAVLLIIGAVMGCTKKADPEMEALKAQMEAMQAELDKAKSGNASAEEIAQIETAVAETAEQETTATPAAAATPATPVIATRDSGNWTVSNGQLIINNGVTSIGEWVFNGRNFEPDNITSVTIPNSVTSIGDHAFQYRNLTSITIPNSVTTIGNEAFSDIEGLTSLTIGNGVTSIGNMAFLQCNSLTSLTIPNSVISIGHSAFGGARLITSITIPSSVKTIGHGAFYSSFKLNSVTFEGDGVKLETMVDSGIVHGPFEGNLHEVYSGRGTYIRTGFDGEGRRGRWTKQ